MGVKREKLIADAWNAHTHGVLEGKPETYVKLNLREAIQEALHGNCDPEEIADIKNQIVPLAVGADVDMDALDELQSRASQAPD
ncbi:hypothetical protein [Metapseudomonas otitidis]|uniref:Uncharacterized protein n=1 Tax=Metapseudomonas otitidis TaxID=319939 RepID=A0A679GSI8_9GAMM|nr:hypothetical protein [Pseudomonas otitidis]BCA30160.1 hypothetical protein PtoMrB4_41370 [Pseudomonas otitidis]